MITDSLNRAPTPYALLVLLTTYLAWQFQDGRSPTAAILARTPVRDVADVDARMRELRGLMRHGAQDRAEVRRLKEAVRVLTIVRSRLRTLQRCASALFLARSR